MRDLVSTLGALYKERCDSQDIVRDVIRWISITFNVLEQTVTISTSEEEEEEE